MTYWICQWPAIFYKTTWGIKLIIKLNNFIFEHCHSTAIYEEDCCKKANNQGILVALVFCKCLNLVASIKHSPEYSCFLSSTGGWFSLGHWVTQSSQSKN